MRRRLRHVCEADTPEWTRMRDALFTEYAAENRQDILRFFESPDPRQAVFVIERETDGLGGFLEVGWRNYAEDCRTSPVAYLEAWYVDPDLRAQGLGRHLVEAAEEWARGQGFREIASDTWIANEDSIRAHKALGYEETERLVCFRKSLA